MKPVRLFRSQTRGLSLAVLTFTLMIMTITSSCNRNRGAGSPAASAPEGKPTVADAQKFTDEAEQRLLGLTVNSSRADWVKSTFITDDTEILSADGNKELIAATTELAEQSRRFEGLDLPPDVARKLKLLRLSLTLAAPKDPAQRDELTKIAASMEGDYGKGKYCPEGATTTVPTSAATPAPGGKSEAGKCLSLGDMEQIMANSRD